MSKLHYLLNVRKDVDDQIKAEKRVLHDDLVMKHRFFFVFMDCLLVIILLSNLGAVLITNFLVVKESDVPVVFEEANPVMSEAHGFVSSAEAKDYFVVVMRQSISWAILVGLYVWFRFTVASWRDVVFGVVCLGASGYIALIDFVHDAGFLLAKLFGGF